MTTEEDVRRAEREIALIAQANAKFEAAEVLGPTRGGQRLLDEANALLEQAALVRDGYAE